MYYLGKKTPWIAIYWAVWFATLDLKSGYQQVPLDEKSSYITIFNTSWGHFHFTKVVFGMSVSSNIFQYKLDAFYVKNVNEITDGIHILGYENGNDHDITLTEFLKVTRVNGLKIGFHKVQIQSEHSSGLWSNHNHR